MSTEKLFYQDSYMRAFTARVLKAERDEQGHFYVVLDRTAFYPTGGGQPHDTGTLNSVHVYDVEEIGGEVRHYIEDPVDVHHEIAGEIDWERRFDHMQQHAGQHILSAAFAEMVGYQTVSFHLGQQICSIDLDAVDLTDEEIMQVENKANDIILENRPVETRWVSAEELSQYPLRKEVSVSDNIRLVIIPDFDYNGCGGTHPNSTGQVSALKMLHWEKQKKKVRVYFVCGGRVLNELGAKHKVIYGLTDTLNVPQEELNETAIRALRLNKDQEKTINELKSKLIDYEAEAYIEQAEESHGGRIVKAVFADRSIPELQQLAKVITANADDMIAVLVNENHNKLQLVCAGGEAVHVNMNDLLKQVLPLINGKGGGTAKIVQGGGERILPPEELMEAFV
ncbi:alanyl-tRNA editing protein [Lentibacillus juripiscarius]|uniref:DHHA1 domain-containing protein n=1 Tax=Lentibacillus juripiscarius TaxID=257446 RepID=A0ABW5V2T0_9BACI